jgi:hypothetical protein
MESHYHEDTVPLAWDHVTSLLVSVLKALRSDPDQPLTTGMRRAVWGDLKNLQRDVGWLMQNTDGAPPRPTTPYVQHLEGVVFTQLHQIQQLEKEVRRHAAQA